jgi:uncharacterized protein (TIGR02285 family)
MKWLGTTLVVLGLAASTLARAQPPLQVDEITWLASDAAVISGPAGMQRASDRLVDWLAQRLPQLRHKRVVANAKRSWLMIRDGQRVCHAGALRQPDRERQAYFSDIGMLPPPHLVLPRDRRDALPLDARGEIDLPALMADPAWRGALVSGRSYGATIDALLAKGPAGATVEMVSASDYGRQLLDMVRKRRVDYTIESAQDLWTLTRGRPDVDDLVTVPIRGASDWVVGGVACPRTPWGLAAIRLVDRELGTPEGAAMLREMLLAQLPPDTARGNAEPIDAFFKRRAKPTPGL